VRGCRSRVLALVTLASGTDHRGDRAKARLVTEVVPPLRTVAHGGFPGSGDRFTAAPRPFRARVRASWESESTSRWVFSHRHCLAYTHSAPWPPDDADRGPRTARAVGSGIRAPAAQRVDCAIEPHLVLSIVLPLDAGRAYTRRGTGATALCATVLCQAVAAAACRPTCAVEFRTGLLAWYSPLR